MVLGFYCNEVMKISRSQIKEAKRRVQEDFAFVGLVEYYNHSICLFHQMLGGHVSWVPEFLNDRPGKRHHEKDEKGMYDTPEIHIGEGLDPIDEELYTAAQNRFFNDIKRYARCPVVVNRCDKTLLQKNLRATQLRYEVSGYLTLQHFDHREVCIP
eukprot:FR741524.1.p1 GENE.FR741524.1~~FR741524.1.p1  ORF type:complete len:156 (+),score=15.50 FR741524.1:1-468(+)